MRKYLLAAALIASATQLMAQSEYDALRFSQTYQQGTARSAAMGGAFGALGGDISVMATNPAGIAIYNKGELTFTPEIISNNTESSFNGQSATDSKFAMKIANFGFVSATQSNRSSGFKGFAWGIGYNRLNDFTNNDRFKNVNSDQSMLDSWVDRANGKQPGNLNYYAEGLGHEVLLLWDDSETDGIHNKINYYNPHSYEWKEEKAPDLYGQTQTRTMNKKGGINTWDFSLAGNYNDMVFFGASLGIQTLHYKFNSVYREQDDKEPYEIPYDYWEFKEEGKSNGAGVNLKVGVLVKPTNYLRFGAAIHTPTLYSITDRYTSQVAVQYNWYDNHDFREAKSDNQDYMYTVVTPMKAILSGAFVVPGYGLLSLDYESVNYTKCRMQSGDDDNYDFEAENNAIKDKFQKTNNFRVGLEGLAGPVALRAGYALYGNPYKWINGDKQRQILSLGVGFRGTDAYIDVTGSYHIYQTEDILYYSEKPAHTRMTALDNRYLHIMVTFGIKFD